MVTDFTKNITTFGFKLVIFENMLSMIVAE